MEKAYSRINWKNGSRSTDTPLNETNMNLMDSAIDVIDGRVCQHDAQIQTLQGYETRAAQSAAEALQSAQNSEDSATDSANSAAASSQSASASALSASSASASATSASQSASSASTSETNASQSEANALVSEQNAKASEDNAKESEENAETYQRNALVYRDLAYGYKNEAQSADLSAQQSASNASTSASNASISESNASTSETNASASATLSQSYAVGGTNTRTGEDTDNAKYYKEQAQQIVDDSTITFTQASTRTNINSGEAISTIMGKIKKFFADLKTVAFTGNASDVSYTNTTSGLSATNVQGAIDEVNNVKITLVAFSDLSKYGIATSGEKINATFEEICKKIPDYCEVRIRWFGNDTTRFGTLASQMPSDVDYCSLYIHNTGYSSPCVIEVIPYNSGSRYLRNYDYVNSTDHLSDWTYLTVGQTYTPGNVPLNTIFATNGTVRNTQGTIARTEGSSTSSQAYTAGQYLMNGGNLKKVTSAIASGESITSNNTSNTTVGAELTQINSNLSVIGKIYSTTTLNTTSVPATTDTVVLQVSNLPLGTYIATGVLFGSTTVNNTGGIIQLKVTGNTTCANTVQNSGFLFSGSVNNVFQITNTSNAVSVTLYCTNAQTIASGKLTIVRIA